MIYIKIYFTLIFVFFMVGVVTCQLANGDDIDDKRSDLWFKITNISWFIVTVMLMVFALTSIWFLD
jgi:hypothetical protein